MSDEVDAVEKAIKDELAAMFAKHGKQFRIDELCWQGRHHWGGSLWIYVNVRFSGRGFSRTRHPSLMSLDMQTDYYGNTVDKDGFLITFRTRKVTIGLDEPFPKIREAMQKFVDKLPECESRIALAKKEEAARQQRRNDLEQKTRLNRMRVEEVIGGEFYSHPRVHPYKDITVDHDSVTVSFKVPIDDFEWFHKAHLGVGL